MFRSLVLATLLSPIAAFAQLSISAYSVDFWNTPVGSFGMDQTIYVTDTQRSSIQVSNGCMTDFHVDNYCYAVEPNQECMIQIRFSPTRQGYQGCTMWIMDSHGFSDTVQISGQGV